MQNEDGRMEKGEERTEFGIVCLKWELFLHFPFSILGVLVSLWQN